MVPSPKELARVHVYVKSVIVCDLYYLSFCYSVSSPRVSGPGIVKIVVRQAAGKEGGQVPTLAVPPSPRIAATQSVLLHPHGTPSSSLRPPTPQQPSLRLPAHPTPPPPPTSSPGQPSRSVLKVVEGTSASTGLGEQNLYQNISIDIKFLFIFGELLIM